MKRFISKLLMGNIVEKHTTNAPYDKVIETLTNVVKDNNFAVVTVHNMKDTYKKKNLELFKYVTPQNHTKH